MQLLLWIRGVHDRMRSGRELLLHVSGRAGAPVAGAKGRRSADGLFEPDQVALHVKLKGAAEIAWRAFHLCKHCFAQFAV